MMFVLGLLLGGAVGFFTAELLHAASDADDQMDAWVSITAQSEDDGLINPAEPFFWRMLDEELNYRMEGW